MFRILTLDKIQIKSLYLAGLTLRETAEIAGCDHTTVRDILVSFGIPRRISKRSKNWWSETSEYQTWINMKQRCTNPKNPRWDRYGGRGIIICDRWINSFLNFLEDVGSKPTTGLTIERIDNNGNYEPGNVKWATQKEQANNRGMKHCSFCGGVGHYANKCL